MSSSRKHSPPAVEAVDPDRGNGHRDAAHRPWQRRRDWGGLVARAWCVIFALVGLMPLTLGAVARLDGFQTWAATKTAELLAEQLDIDASYQLEITPWPLEIMMSNVVVEASDGGTPVLQARNVVARPRIFSLLAGKPDLGEVEVEDARVRVVVRDGALINLHYQLPEQSDEGEPLEELPVSAVALTNAMVDATVDDVRVVSDEIDVDITLGRMSGDKKPMLPIGLLEISLRAGRTDIDHRHAAPHAPELDMVDEDVLCHVELRARIADNVLVRRMQLDGAIDFDPGPDTRPNCNLVGEDWRKLALSLEGGEIRFSPNGELDSLDGRIKARAPAAVAHRFADLPPLTGWLAIDLEQAHYDNRLRIPNATGTIVGGGLGIDAKRVAHDLAGEVSINDDIVDLKDLKVSWAGGKANFSQIQVQPFAEGMPLDVKDVAIEGITLQHLLDDLAAHPHAHVAWSLERTTFDSFKGTLMPLDLAGMLVSETRDFGVFDLPHDDPRRRQLMGITAATVSGNFKVTPDAVVLSQMTVQTGGSTVRTTVSLGYAERLQLSVFEGSTVDLSDVSPLADIPMEGLARISADGAGYFGDPHFEAKLEVDNFSFGGFPIGDIRQSNVDFIPLQLRFTDAKVRHGDSDVDVPLLNLDFDDGDADVIMDASIDTNASGIHLHDLFEMVQLLPLQRRERLALPKQDPTWEEIDGKAFGTANVHYVLGGRRDRCASGRLEVGTRMRLEGVELWDIHYETGDIDLDWLWDDIEAGDHGLVANLHSGVLRKGTGTIVANASIRHGAELRADVVATAIPLSEIAAFRRAFGLDEREDENSAVRQIRPEATVSFVASVGGKLGQLEGHADIDLSSMRIGPDLLPPSRLSLDIVPSGHSAQQIGRSKCGHAITQRFNPQRWASDLSSGIFRLGGELFDGQVSFDDLQITQQRAKMMSGQLDLTDLDLGALANLLPDVAFSAKPPRGTLTAQVFVDELPFDDPALAEIRLFVTEAELKRGDTLLRIGKVDDPVLLSGDAVRIPTVPFQIRFGSGLNAELVGGGDIRRLSTKPELSLSSELQPIDLSTLGVDIPQIKRASGIMHASLTVDGPLDEPRLGGKLVLDNGMLRVKGLPLPLDDIDLDLRIRGGEVNIRRATARVGNTGRLAVSGRLPMRGLDIVGADATLVASDVKVPVADGVKLAADARLRATFDAQDKGRKLPNISGRVTLKNFSYTRPMSFRVDLDQLTGGGRTQVDTYKPEDDMFDFDIAVVSPQPVRIANNLLDLRLDITPPGIRISGTDQRFGARGQLRIAQGGKLYLQGHDFTVRGGTVDFDNPTRIAPKLDVRATTEYRRYSANVDTDAASAADASSGGSSASGGRWRIALHAYGDTDQPEVRFSSDPPLSQEDIVLLLSVGMTQAELDRNLSSALAQTVGLEALNAVTGLDQALRTGVPVIDEFRVGTQYSSRTGRPEPAVTLGKRLTDDVRATVTTGLSEDREVRSNIEWRLKGGVSVQGSYDNVNEVSSSALGNVGAGLRWRLEFE